MAAQHMPDGRPRVEAAEGPPRRRSRGEYCGASGLPMLASAKVPDEALVAAADESAADGPEFAYLRWLPGEIDRGGRAASATPGSPPEAARPARP